MDGFDWIYDKIYSMENVYTYLYYEYVDANMSHIMWRLVPVINEWSEQETKTNTLELLDSIITGHYADFNAFLKEHPEMDCDFTHDAIETIWKEINRPGNEIMEGVIDINELIKDTSTMERIVKIINGLWSGVAKLISNPNDGYLACEIGDSWFYFAGPEYEDMKPEEVNRHFDIFTLAQMILNAIVDLDDDEYTYYCDMLEFA